MDYLPYENMIPSQGLQMPNHQQRIDISQINVAKVPYYCPTTFVEINRELDAMAIQTTKVTELNRNLETEQGKMSIQYYEYQKICSNHDHLLQRQAASAYDQSTINKLNQQKTFYKHFRQELTNRVNGIYSIIAQKLQENVKRNDEILKRLLDKELVIWQRNQQYPGNGRECEVSHLDTLQNWMERLTTLIWHSLTQVKEAIRLIEKFYTSNQAIESNVNMRSLKSLVEIISGQLRSVTIRSFIIEKQPPQVLKTQTKFTAKVRFLVSSSLGLNMHLPRVKVMIISEAQANHLSKEKILKGDGCGEIKNNMGTMEVDPVTKQLTVTFRNLMLPKVIRAEKKGTESVLDEKCALYFCTTVKIGSDFSLPVWALSLPVSVIVHGNQEAHAWATVIWDNAFAEPGREPFVVPDKVYWGKLSEALNLRFATVTGRPLSNDNMKYLAERLFKFKSDEYDSMQVSWAQFSKEPLINGNFTTSFTFWDWFYAIMKVTREHLKPLWMDNLIMGYVHKIEAENLLINSPLGTFLLRFSESELGGITIAWHDTEIDEVGNERSHVMMLQPFTSKDFAIRALADRINDLHQIKYLYPNIPKDIAFERYYTPYYDHSSLQTGYIKPQLIIHVPGRNIPQNDRFFIGPGGLSSYPTTPNSTLHTGMPPDLLNANDFRFIGNQDVASDRMEYADLDIDLASYQF